MDRNKAVGYLIARAMAAQVFGNEERCRAFTEAARIIENMPPGPCERSTKDEGDKGGNTGSKRSYPCHVKRPRHVWRSLQVVRSIVQTNGLAFEIHMQSILFVRMTLRGPMRPDNRDQTK
ncbi:MAG: hypothetical protein SA339_10210 [Methanomassiliicoccus sp.]|nr:hypothetical protein [Methanomassiliicoccus sp.]